MKNLEIFEKKYLEKIKQDKTVPDFKPGDTIIVHVKVVEKKRERTQAFEGVCIAKKNAGVNSSFTVRKVSYGEGLERLFPLYSPNVAKIEIKTKGKVKRAKLYYLRNLSGRKSKISEDKSLKKEDAETKAKKDDIINKNKLKEKTIKEPKDIKKNVEKSEKKSSDTKETKDNYKNKED
tara:strand:- start:601 stop:1134 length:534 start_codon:yes stop_codon:yes gene_type:complete